jgi:replicative DNA helicase
MAAPADMRRVEKGDLSKWGDVVQAAKRLIGLPFWVEYAPRMTPQRLHARCRRLKASHGLDLVVVDYLQLMDCGLPGSTVNSREQEIAHISRELKALAGELGIPVVSVSQLNRKAADIKPSKHHLRYSGSIEQDADAITLLWRPEKDGRITTAIVDKHRMGPEGEVDLKWTPEHVRFDDADDAMAYTVGGYEPPV